MKRICRHCGEPVIPELNVKYKWTHTTGYGNIVWSRCLDEGNRWADPVSEGVLIITDEQLVQNSNLRTATIS